LSEEEKLMIKDVKSTKDFMKENPGVFVTKADKGVILDRQDYIQGMENIFSDTTTYVRINKYKTLSVQTKRNKMISRWKDMAYIDFYTAKKNQVSKWNYCQVLWPTKNS
jgi:hypothetical protein